MKPEHIEEILLNSKATSVNFSYTTFTDLAKVPLSV